ncbi:hypothetical protein C2869_18675 [Saccharobesus litoralis]|uniref:Uncharacterized protein n=1 Tax=Saccharobesus litoralis TaxID=2172099 RepID=A0A2S0VVR3_9ALTE|nr:hypothetical protein [Saccharobesus litoralis]AWB68306.1 hypothetical protein C2869_18675 [Saccharobesus litoralis]
MTPLVLTPLVPLVPEYQNDSAFKIEVDNFKKTVDALKNASDNNTLEYKVVHQQFDKQKNSVPNATIKVTNYDQSAQGN